MNNPLTIKDRTEQRLAKSIHWHPNVISSLKLLLALPIIAILFYPYLLSGLTPVIIVLAFILFGLLDYLDGMVAKQHDKESLFGRYYDRLTDYPLLLVLAYLTLDMIPLPLILAKIVLDAVLLYLYARYHYYSYNRLRTGIHYLTLFVLLLSALNLSAPFINAALASKLLTLNCFVNAIIILIHFGVLKKKYIADSLSLGNLLCGAVAIYMAWQARLDLSILFLLLGSLFDGLDGYAARKFGSTRFGVYSDDIADGFTYGIAPAAALSIHFYQYDPSLLIDGLVIGSIYAVFTISRLVYFTLNKDYADANYFQGAPSTVGGIVVLSSCYLFGDHVSLIAMCIGFVCMLMVSLNTQYRHLGRLMQNIQLKRRLMVPAMLLLITLLATGNSFWLIVMLFGITFVYGLSPIALLFKQIIVSHVHNRRVQRG